MYNLGITVKRDELLSRLLMPPVQMKVWSFTRWQQ